LLAYTSKNINKIINLEPYLEISKRKLQIGI